jgi:CheY-like chemotaxis protein
MPQERLHRARGSGRLFRILIAEDIEANALLVTTRLKLQGHTVRIAGNGAEAVKAFQQEQFDIILMDVHMPQMDGIEATVIIRAIERERVNNNSDDDKIDIDNSVSHIPVIALTASIMKDEIKRFLAAGMDSFVGKPIDFNELTRVLDKYIPYKNSEDNQEDCDEAAPCNHHEEQPTEHQHHNDGMETQSEVSKFDSEDINFDEGLDRCGDDTSFYIDWLTKFFDQYGDIPERITSMIKGEDETGWHIDAGDIDKAYELTHAVKGVSANLSLNKVTTIAGKINAALHSYKNGDLGKIRDIKNDTNLLETALNQASDAVNAIKTRYYESVEKKSTSRPVHRQQSEENNLKPENMDEINRIISEMQGCIAEYSPDGIEPLIENLEQYLPPEYLKAIRKYVDDFNFGGAENELDKLITRLKAINNKS